jgi:carbon-monoxide dehydrogenase medium subunit
MRLSSPSCLIDISKLKDLSEIKLDDNSIYIGALATHNQVMDNSIIKENFPSLIEILKMVAHPAIRNKGTHGGSMAYGDPAAELPAFAVANNAKIILSGLNGKRTVEANDFYLGLFETDIQPDEILVGINYPLLKSNEKIVFEEVCRRHGDYAMAGLIAKVQINQSVIENITLVFFATGDRPNLTFKTSELVVKSGYDYSSLKKSLSSDIDFAGDLNSSASMKLHLATILIGKILKKLED